MTETNKYPHSLRQAYLYVLVRVIEESLKAKGTKPIDPLPAITLEVPQRQQRLGYYDDDESDNNGVNL